MCLKAFTIFIKLIKVKLATITSRRLTIRYKKSHLVEALKMVSFWFIFGFLFLQLFL